ncbi:putative tetratricopeptide-like helical domain-containing protein [Rosa chinensis]|uniref:Putative tetratricopeptide-like helical domain-containing protein n=1 Tax=Rosa chinensis TaxID=74649 RepID=A0A2P6PU89_ROSCH|nr:putative pentatricopeptide repeat-containing protein At3g25060, mitochondrial [Rosa chinensis]PRQ25491.1 putative tetratricopeptide-like helical domain-containing protein [Rosa chinensis]
MGLLPWPNRLRPLLLSCKHKPSVAQIHALMIVTGAITHANSNAPLIASYASIGDTETARKVFDEMPQRNIHAWNAMIIAYSRQHCPSEALSLYSRMISEGVRPDSSTFTGALKACAGMLDLKMGEEVWSKAARCGYEGDVFVASSVLNLYAKCGKTDEAVAVFDKIPRRDLVCCTTMITGFLQSGRPVEAVEVYRRMQNEGMEFDGVVMMGLVQACASLGDLRLGLSVHGYMIRRGIPMDVMVQTSLVDMYAKSGHFELASCVFNRMPYRNAVSWGALISGFAQNGFAGHALEMVVEMQSCGFEPESASLVSSLLACSQVGLLKLGKSVHGYILKRLEIGQVCGTAVIDMYSKCGSLSYARALFDQMVSRDLISWNAMIASYGIHGCGEEALTLFLQLTETNLKPDHSTFASLLSAFSHSGLVEEGLHWFDVMVAKYKIPPGEKHYACMVDLLARSGRVEEASELIASMNTEPGLAVWVALLAGCHNHRKLSIGEIAAKKVLEFNPDDLGVYALVSNFYAMARRWEGVAGTKKIMKQTGTKKVPGYSLVEVNGELHAFLMEDKSHHHHEDIMLLLNKLYHDMRAIGYVPKSEALLHNFEEAHSSEQRKFIKLL